MAGARSTTLPSHRESRATLSQHHTPASFAEDARVTNPGYAAAACCCHTPAFGLAGIVLLTVPDHAASGSGVTRSPMPPALPRFLLRIAVVPRPTICLMYNRLSPAAATKAGTIFDWVVSSDAQP
jgi:hypothetical protein